MGNAMTLDDIPFTVKSLSQRIQRRVQHLQFERSNNAVKGIARGQRGLEIEAFTRTDADYDSLVTMFDGQATAILADNQRGEKYSGTYVLGDIEFDDQTHSTANIHFRFTLWDRGQAGPTGGVTEFMVSEGAVGE